MLTVNLTTTSERLDLCRIALTSLTTQSKLPDKINLWVSKEPYLRDRGIAELNIERLIMSLPEDARHLISIRWTENIGPYRKLIPVLREADPEDLIVTADDDIFYGEHWLAELLAEHVGHLGKVIAARVRKVRYGVLGVRTSYKHWPLVNESGLLSNDYVITFGGGVVLSKRMFREQDINDISFLEVAPTTDDLWYTKLLQLNNQQVRAVPAAMGELTSMIHPHGLITINTGAHESPLWLKALTKIWVQSYGLLGGSVCGNDQAFRRIERYFGAGQ